MNLTDEAQQRSKSCMRQSKPKPRGIQYTDIRGALPRTVPTDTEAYLISRFTVIPGIGLRTQETDVQS